MTLENDLHNALIQDTTLNAIIGDRVYPLLIPQDAAYPAIAYQRISGKNLRSHDGADSLENVRVQLTLVAESFEMVKNLEKEVNRVLDGKKIGNLMIFIENRTDDVSGNGLVWSERIDLKILYG